MAISLLPGPCLRIGWLPLDTMGFHQKHMSVMDKLGLQPGLLHIGNDDVLSGRLWGCSGAFHGTSFCVFFKVSVSTPNAKSAIT